MATSKMPVKLFKEPLCHLLSVVGGTVALWYAHCPLAARYWLCGVPDCPDTFLDMLTARLIDQRNISSL